MQRSCITILMILAMTGIASAATGRTPEGAPPEPPEEMIQQEKPGLLARKLQGPMKDIEEVFFAVHGTGQEWHFFATTGHECGNPSRRYDLTGPALLCAVDLRTKQIRTIYHEPGATLRDPCLSDDGKRVVFSYKANGEDIFHLWEMDLQTQEKRQITHGKFDDIEPIYLPPHPATGKSEGFVFSSARCRRTVPCFVSPVQTLYRCDGDGGNVRAMTAGAENELTPWMLPDGRIIYMRWEYVERDVRTYHHLWTINPDGTGEMVYFGNGPESYVSVPGGLVMLNPMGIPGTQKAVCTIGTKHGNRGYRGHVAVIDPTGGPDDWGGIEYLTGGPRKLIGEPFMDPYAIDDDTFLVSTTGGRNGTGKLLVMDSKGNYEVICESPAGRYDIRSPQPLVPREPALWKPPAVDLTQATGEVLLARAHVGRDMDAVEPGEVAKLLILEVLPLPTKGIGPKLHHGADGHNIRRVLGTVPVAPDGSAYFKAPAMRAIQLVALDKDHKAIKRMRSFMTVQPGSLNSCVGCHEERTTTIEPARLGALLATRQGPKEIQPIAGLPESGIIDFPRDVQPVLDKHCVSCHNYKRRKSDIVLEGGRTDDASLSYQPLRGRSAIRGSEGGDKPYKYGSAASSLLKMLDKGHHDVKLSKEEMNLIRVWIDSGAFWAGHTVPALGARVVASDEEQKKNPLPVNFDAAVLQKRCDRCHSPGRSNRRRLLRGEKFDFTHPRRSLLLLAPLSKEAGGLGRCKARKDQKLDGPVFASTQDPDYQALLAQIKRAGKAIGADDPHWDGDFVSLPGWYYEMRRFDVLPAEMPDQTPIDPFQVEQRYYRFFYPEYPGGVGPKIPSARGGHPKP